MNAPLGVKTWGAAYMNPTTPGEEPTHLLQNGGKLYVPVSERITFWNMVAKDITQGVSNFISEQRSPVFKLHVDIDIFEPETISEATLSDWFTDVQFVIKSFFESGNPKVRTNTTRKEDYDFLSMIVCRSPTKESAEKEKRLWSKTGVHLIWPHIQVTVLEALKIRSGLIQHFETKYGRRDPANIWEDVFDQSIYRSNGLRMVGSSKLEICKFCRGKPSKTKICPGGQCNGYLGKVDAKRAYRADTVINREGGVDEPLKVCVLSSVKTEVRTTSIRLDSKATVTKMETPKWFDSTFFQDELDKHKSVFAPTPTERRNRRALLGEASENILGAESLGLTKRPRLEKGDPRVVALQKWLRKSDLPDGFKLPDVYRNTEVVDLTIFSGDQQPYYIARTDSLFCLNKGSEHNNNNIYFLINENGFYQKCFCQCNTSEGREFGPCKDYRSSPYQLPADVLKHFYPDRYRQQSTAENIIFTQNLREMNTETKDLLIENKWQELIRKSDTMRTKGKAKLERRFVSKRDVAKK